MLLYSEVCLKYIYMQLELEQINETFIYNILYAPAIFCDVLVMYKVVQIWPGLICV